MVTRTAVVGAAFGVDFRKAQPPDPGDHVGARLKVSTIRDYYSDASCAGTPTTISRPQGDEPTCRSHPRQAESAVHPCPCNAYPTCMRGGPSRKRARVPCAANELTGARLAQALHQHDDRQDQRSCEDAKEQIEHWREQESERGADPRRARRSLDYVMNQVVSER